MKTVANLDEKLLKILLFSYNRLESIYSDLQNRSYLCEKSRYQESYGLIKFGSLI